MSDEYREAYNELLRPFKIGGVVALQSGGPLMTVSDTVFWQKPPHMTASLLFPYNPIDWPMPGVNCSWIDEAGVPHRERYQPEMLLLRKEKEESSS